MSIRDFYILGLPVSTEIGDIQFIKVKDYPQYYMDLQVVSWGKLEVIGKYSEINKDGTLDEMIDEMRKLSLYEIAMGLSDMRESYENVFLKSLDNEDALAMINIDNFDYYRQLIMEMNFVKEEKINPNPEIQEAVERSKRVKSRDSDKLTFSDVCSSVVAYSGKSYDDILNFTIYQLYMTFYRIGQIKNYDTTTLFSTVSSEKINIESWSKHIDPYEDEKHYMTESEFRNTTGKAIGE